MANNNVKKKKTELFDVVNTSLVVLITLIVIYPLYFSVIASFSGPKQVALGNTLLWVKDFTTEAYRYVLEEEQLWIGYRNSIIYLILGTLYNLILTIPAAYVMSKKYLPFRGALSWYFFITMYISGGMIPSYLLVKDLGLIDNPLVMIIGAGVSCYNLIVTRQYFSSSIPEDIYEACYIDGASELICFTKIALPLAKPIIAVMALYYGVGHWNSYYSALLYLRKAKYYPLQLVLRNILISNELSTAAIENADAETVAYLVHRAEMVQVMKYAIIFIASAPLLIAYPFVQKHFTKGIMIGSVKG
ncbi:MAG: carbohydrate ABC transporter permease [Agathobacter sp.]|nr:carbohydrate ABC transporter permease [Lachnospiraceae bacterium]MBR3810702.1 carbohydrate ABC transporter permease [Agathobacter sp.]